MRNTIKTLTLGTIACMMIACASQKNQASSEMQHTSRQQEARQQGGAPSYAQLLSEMDANKDGKLSKAEVKGPLQNDFSKIDTDGNGFISQAEFDKAPKPKRGQHPPQNK